MKREYKILTALVVSSLMGFSAMTAEAEALTLTGSITDTKITGNSDTGTTSGNTLNVTNASGNSSSSGSVLHQDPLLQAEVYPIKSQATHRIIPSVFQEVYLPNIKFMVLHAFLWDKNNNI